MKKKPLDPKATVRIAVPAAVWEIIPVWIVSPSPPTTSINDGFDSTNISNGEFNYKSKNIPPSLLLVVGSDDL